MEKYRRVVKKERAGDSKDDEIRITAKGRPGLYVSYAAKLLQEKELKAFTLKATGQALATAVIVAEVMKRRFKGLHQLTKLGSTQVTDEWEPLEEGLDPVTSVRNVSFIEITLSTEDNLDKANLGYQEPIPEDEVTEYKDDPRKREDGEEGEGEDGESKPRSRGKGKGKRASKGKGKGKGKGKDSKGKGKDSKGKGKDKDGAKGKGKKSSKGKGKGKGKGKRGKSSSKGRKNSE